MNVIPGPKEWNRFSGNLRGHWAQGLKGCEDPELTPGLPATHPPPESGRDVWSRFPEASALGRLRKLSPQVLALLFAWIDY